MQGKPLFDRKKRLSRLEKGVSLILLKASPSPSEGGDVLPRGFFFNSKTQLSLIPQTILSHPTNSIHAPLHSERGRGRGLSSLFKCALSLMNNGLDNDLTLLSLCENLRCDLRNILFREGLEDGF